jgi:hypothetical protein
MSEQFPNLPADFVDDPNNPLPPILGEDPDPWMTQEEIQAGLEAKSPLDMNVNQFLTLTRDAQDMILNAWEGPNGSGQLQIAPWDSNDPANAPNLPAKLWYAAQQNSRFRYQDPQSVRQISFADAMLGPNDRPVPGGQLVPVPGEPRVPITPTPFGEGRWDLGGIATQRAPVWGFSSIPQPKLRELASFQRLPTDDPRFYGSSLSLDPDAFGSLAPSPRRRVVGRRPDGSPIYEGQI